MIPKIGDVIQLTEQFLVMEDDELEDYGMKEGPQSGSCGIIIDISLNGPSSFSYTILFSAEIMIEIYGEEFVCV